MKNVIGIDIGASFIKGAVFYGKRRTMRFIAKVPSPHPRSSLLNRHETDPALYLKLTRALVQKLLRKAGKNVEGLVVSGQMHGMVLVDGNNRAVTRFIGWQDERALEISQIHGVSWLDLYKRKLKGINLQNTGITLRAGLSGLTLFWLKEQGVLKQYPNSQLLSIGDFIVTALTHGKRSMHPTHACGTALFDVKRNDWNQKILKALGIPRRHMPQIVNTGDVVGYLQGGSMKIPVFVCIGDLQAAVLGSMVSPGMLNINVGTGSQVSMVSQSFARTKHDVRSYFDNMYLNTVTFIPAGRALNVITRFIEEIGKKIYDKSEVDVWERLHRLLRNKNGSEGLSARISYFSGNATGFDTGIWKGITEKNWTLANMIYAALANMADNYWDASMRLKVRGIKRIVLSGGLVRKSEILRSLIKKRFKLPVALTTIEEETLAGLFIVSLFSTGRFPTIMSAVSYCKKNRIRVQHSQIV